MQAIVTAQRYSHTVTITKVVTCLRLGRYPAKKEPMVPQALLHITKASETIQTDLILVVTRTCTKLLTLKWFKITPIKLINKIQLLQQMSL